MKPFPIFLTITLLLHSIFSLAQEAIAPSEFQSLITEQAAVQLIDVRTAGEYAGGSLQGAQNIDIRSSSFSNDISKLDKTRPIFVYCLSGGRSASAARQMVSMGFAEVYDMKGGIMSWKRSGLPLANGNSKSAGMSKAKYDNMIKAEVPVLVNIYAPWCGPCRKMKPMLDDLEKSGAGKFKYVMLNADDNDALLKELGVKEIPTFFIYKNGTQTWKHVGLVEQVTLVKELGL